MISFNCVQKLLAEMCLFRVLKAVLSYLQHFLHVCKFERLVWEAILPTLRFKHLVHVFELLILVVVEETLDWSELLTLANFDLCFVNIDLIASLFEKEL